MANIDQQAPATGAIRGDAPLTGDQRLALVRTLQGQAAQRPDPLAANLGVLAGDLLGFAHLLAPAVQADLAEGPTSPQAQERVRRDAEMILRLLRQAERCAQVEGKPLPPATGAPR